MSSSDFRQRKVELSPLVRRVIELARHAGPHDMQSHPGEADFLAGAAVLAAQQIGLRGFLAPHPDLYVSIEALASRHLDWNDARADFRRALESVRDRDVTDALESAHGRVITTSDTAYYYVGLAFGLTLADLAPQR